MTTVRVAAEAMATRFEAVLHGGREAALRAAGEEAMAEIVRIEGLLSLYRPESEIAAVNRAADRAPVRVSPEVFGLLEHAVLLSRLTDGAFDITVAPLLRAWGLMRGTGQVPGPEEREAIRGVIGVDLLDLDPERWTVGFRRSGVMVDLGSIGKGYALDRAAERLREAGVTSGLLHGGTSTAIALGTPPEAPAWRIALEAPAGPPAAGDRATNDRPPLGVVALRDESLSVSAVWGKGFESGGRYYGHVIDPRRGEPVQGAWLAAVVLPSATESDALSTALLVRGEEMAAKLGAGEAPIRCLVVEPSDLSPGYRVCGPGLSMGNSATTQ